MASEGAESCCFWLQIRRSDRQARPPALHNGPYRPRVIRHVQPITEGVGEWRLATLQHTLSRERETVLSVIVLQALEKCVSARKLATEGGLDGGRWGQRQSATAAPRPTSPRDLKLCCTSSEDVTYIYEDV